MLEAKVILPNADYFPDLYDKAPHVGGKALATNVRIPSGRSAKRRARDLSRRDRGTARNPRLLVCVKPMAAPGRTLTI
jgi:hypothetical protein